MSDLNDLELVIKADIFARMGAEPDLVLMDNPIGRATYYDRNKGTKWVVPYGVGGKGAPDIIGILRREFLGGEGVGLFVAWEVKQPGEEPKPHQEKIAKIWRAMGALVYCAHSPEEAYAQLEEARQWP